MWYIIEYWVNDFNATFPRGVAYTKSAKKKNELVKKFSDEIFYDGYKVTTSRKRPW